MNTGPEQLPPGCRWVKRREWLRSNDASWSDLQEAWTPRWDAHLSNYTLRPFKCQTAKTYIRNLTQRISP